MMLWTHDDFGIEMDEMNSLSFNMCGITVFFKTHVPTDQEWDTCWHIVMTSDVPMGSHISHYWFDAATLMGAGGIS